MFTRQPLWISHLAAWAASHLSFLKIFLSPLYQRYLSMLNRHRNSLFRQNGMKVLKQFDECLTRNGFQYTLAFGSMLGAVREHGFISHDLDMDVAMWIEDYTPRLRKCLKEYGFKLFHELTVDEGKSGREETYELNGVTIDIFYIYPAMDQYPYCCDFVGHEDVPAFSDSMKKYGYIIARRLQLPWKKELQRVPFGDAMLPIPVNAHEILSFRYGEDYMTPNPDWHYTDANKYTTVWEEKKGIMKKG